MGEELGIYSDLELDAARQLVRQLIRAVRSVRLYDAHHPTLASLHEQLRKRWEQATAGGPLSLRLSRESVLLEGEVVYQSTGAGDVLPTVLYEHGIVGFVLRRGIEADEARRFVGAIAAEVEKTPDYASLLWEADLRHVQVLLDSSDIGEEETADPAGFEKTMQSLGDAGDTPAGQDYPQEVREMEALAEAQRNSEVHSGPDLCALTPGERQRIASMLQGDTYLATVRHAGRVVHRIARDGVPAGEASALEQGLEAVISTIVAFGDVAGATELLDRAEKLRASSHTLEVRIGELTLQLLSEAQAVRAMLEVTDLQESLDPRACMEFLRRLGTGALPTVAQWLLETSHPSEIAQSLAIFGDDAVRALLPLYQRSPQEKRDRIAPALLRIGTSEALAALAADFSGIPEQARLQVLETIARIGGPELRPLVVSALRDPSERVRRAAISALRKTDAPLITPLLGEILADCDKTRGEEERLDLFEALARIGDAGVAKVLAAECTRGGLTLRLRGLNAVQQLCVRALRRMRAPDARSVVAELHRKAPRPVREALDDPLADL